MTKKNNNKSKSSKKIRTPARKARIPRVFMSPSPLSDPRVAAWDQLLRDPCSANLTAPCYAGADSGYLIRTVDNFTLTAGGAVAGTIGAQVKSNYVFQFTPFNTSLTTGVVLTGSVNTAAALPNALNSGLSSNFVTSASVHRYRCVAACLKWVPSGPYGTRQGVVGLGYAPGQIINSGEPIGVSPLLSECQRIANNGSDTHEVRWLPSAVDENFTTTAAAANSGAGTLYAVLRDVDATLTSATDGTINGYMELTAVWEWTPARTTGLSVAPKAPLPYTSQQVLATITDMGKYLFEGARTASGNGMVRAGVRMGMRLLTAGIGSQTTRGPSMPTITH